MPQPIPDLSRDQQCHHFQAPTGQRCGSPALKGEYYCYHHHLNRPKRSQQRVLIDPEITRMELPVIEDRASIFVALAAVIHRLADNTIDTRRAGQMIYALQTSLQALQPERPTAPSQHPPRSPPLPIVILSEAEDLLLSPSVSPEGGKTHRRSFLQPHPNRSPSPRKASSTSSALATAPTATPSSSRRTS